MDNVVREFQISPWIPHGYQDRGIKWLVERVSAALFLAPGLGKTSITLAAICKLKEYGIPARTLVLAPKTVCITTWMSEPKKWLQFAGLKVGFAHGMWREEVATDLSYDIVVTNYDSLVWLAPLLAQGHKFDIVIYDELSKLKNTQAKRFKLLKPILHTFRQRWGLTGTPASNSLLDLFGEMFVLDLGQTFGRYITHFRMTYFYQKPFDQYRWYVMPQKQATMIEKLKPTAMFVDPKEWLELPDFIPVERLVEFDDATRKQYKTLEDDYIIKVKEGVVTAANAGVLTSKLRQFTGGAVYIKEREPGHIHDEKIDALNDLIDELGGENLIVVYLFDHERERILKHYPNALTLKGGMSDKAIKDTVDAWNSGASQIMLVQPASSKYGLNLQQGGSRICWFTMTYDLEEFTQMNARIYRQGQKTDKVFCYLLLANKTIDQWVSKVLTDKDATQEKLFKALLLEEERDEV